MVFQRPRGGGAVELPGGLELVPDGGPRLRVPAQLHEREGEGLVHLVRAGVAGGAGRLQVDLAHQQAVRLILLGEGAPAAVDLVDVLLVRDLRVGPQPVHHPALGRRIRQPVGLEQRMRDVDPQPVHALVEPEAQHAVEEIADGGIAPVPVRLPGREEVQVPVRVRRRVRGWRGSRPGRRRRSASCSAGRRSRPNVGAVRRSAGAAVVGHAHRTRHKVEHVPLRRARAGREGRLEQRVLRGAVVGDDVEQDPQAQRVGLLQERIELFHGAEQRVHAAVVADVVALVHLRGGLERGHPDPVDAEGGDVRQPGDEAGEVAHAVAVAVGEGARVDLVDDGGLPPVGSGGQRRFRRHGGVLQRKRFETQGCNAHSLVPAVRPSTIRRWKASATMTNGTVTIIPSGICSPKAPEFPWNR